MCLRTYLRVPLLVGLDHQIVDPLFQQAGPVASEEASVDGSELMAALVVLLRRIS